MPLKVRSALRLPNPRAFNSTPLTQTREFHRIGRGRSVNCHIRPGYPWLKLDQSSSLSTAATTTNTMSRSPSKQNEPRPSSSIVLLSPQNQVLLLHRVRTSTSFASAHVFPGGNLDAFHDGALPGVEDPGRHEDGLAYRMGAVRECFEETGILLARKKGEGGGLVGVEVEERDEVRKRIHGSQVAFGAWLESIGAIADTDNLIPFTRWVTPNNVPKRFTTQMYLYLLPLAGTTASLPSEMLIPTPDNGVEHTAATFAPAQTFLARAAAKDIILFPPQAFLLTLLTHFLSLPSPSASTDYSTQRQRLLTFINTVPTADTPRGRDHPVSQIPWGDKCISPHNLFIREGDGRVVLGLDKPGPELKGSGRGGDWERVVLVRFGKGGPSEVEVRKREDVLEEEKRTKKDAGGDAKL